VSLSVQAALLPEGERKIVAALFATPRCFVLGARPPPEHDPHMG
jgi:hypothetical protein